MRERDERAGNAEDGSRPSVTSETSAPRCGVDRRAPAPPKIVFAGLFEGTGDYPAHKHEGAWELIYLRRGRIREIVGTEVLEMKPGMFVVHPPDTRHGDLASSDYGLYHVLVTNMGRLHWPETGEDLAGAPMAEVLSLIVNEWYCGWQHRDAYLKHAAALLDILMERSAARTKEAKAALGVVMEVRGIFRREFRDPISQREVAIRLGISRSTLYEYFHQVLGRPPHVVLDEIRLKHAVFLLKHSRLTIEEVATGSGYNSGSHLGRKLRAEYGVSPRDVRVAAAKLLGGD